ncbi:hypothetical protein [Bacillus sp. cl95]|uniref:hypothetical protein n=1 Tax=Bacillus sp. cl95 TaxID=1761761 RepID=UPI0008EAD473|nr:hypothetical protein [Bacillus sp. cl95]SFQ66259.1 hypothetical protein SAMN04488577_0867 [Bacillus sp. cl95]
MKIYMVVLLQLIIWSAYTLIEWLSKHDHPIYNVMMFLVFTYIACFIGHTITKSVRTTMFVTLFSLIVYGSFHISMYMFTN